MIAAAATGTRHHDTPSEILVRRAVAGDLDAILAIEREAYPRPWTADLWRLELRRPERVHLVAMEPGVRGPGVVVGFAGALVAADEAQITTVAVAAAHRRRGIAATLLLELLAAVDLAGALAATLEVRESDTGTQVLYARFGFVSAGVRPGYYQDNGEGAVIMWLHDLRTAAVARHLRAVARARRMVLPNTFAERC